MKIRTVRLICFSPTGTTRKILVGIAAGLGIKEVEAINLTPPEGGRENLALGSDELAIIGVPVYGGRMPAEAIKRLRKITASATPAVVVVVYGNREFEDSLLELKNLAREQGFLPIAAAAFVGEHSFSTEALPIAVGRPDALDMDKAAGFGRAVAAKLSRLAQATLAKDVPLPGRFPYEGGARVMAVAPVTNVDRCTLCGVCAGVCPTAAITVDDRVTTAVEACIRCCACIKNCPEEARFWEDPMMLKISHWLHENCQARKEPQWFGVEV